MTDGCFYGDGGFMTVISPNAADLETAFASKVYDMLSYLHLSSEDFSREFKRK